MHQMVLLDGFDSSVLILLSHWCKTITIPFWSKYEPMPCLLLHFLNETTENTSGGGEKGIQMFHEEIKRYAQKNKKGGENDMQSRKRQLLEMSWARN